MYIFVTYHVIEQEESKLLQSKCDRTLADLEREAGEVTALKQGLDRRHRQAEKETADLAARELEFTR